jgi:methylated-DNA-protein-cysteine methyltransferase-like protein
MDVNFRTKIEQLMAQVPSGKVTTYGDLAGLAGHAHAARVVGTIAHYGDESLPWHRLVNRFGGLASGYWGGREVQAAMLEIEGVYSNPDFIIVDFKERRWQPIL